MTMPLLRVADTLAGLTALGAAGRARAAARVVGVTGSVGKTTTKEMLRVALSAFGPTHASAASFNNHGGVKSSWWRRYCRCNQRRRPDQWHCYDGKY
jgi:UDP-N-acetylmuramyl pentapeptide synthase